MSDIHSKQSEYKKSQTALDEEQVLEFWQENNIFEKSVSQRDGMEEFVFFDGPPFATGLPHYGHILPGTIKDVIPRYQTMRGKQVVRKWGWDTHGLPIENIIEKKLDLNSRKDILDYGIDNFNQAARDQVLAFKDQWEQIMPRTGRWVDMQDHYKTMDASYTESCWWAFKELDKQGLVYKGYKPMHLCPRCETTLSNNEVAEGYEDITDISVTVKFELADEPGTYLLAWTTTPWTLPGNTAIAVGKDVVYVKVRVATDDGDVHYIVAKERLEDVMNHAGITEWEEVSVLGSDALVGQSYIPPYDYYHSNTKLEHHENGWKVWEADFVTDDAGTGIAHEAPAFGADDFYLAQKENIPMVHHVGTNGRFVDEVTDFAGQLVKAKGDHQSADIEIIKNLAHRGFLFSKEKITHAYPHCWRCDTPLLNYATTSWFIRTTKLRDRMLAENTDIHWVPDHLGHKRFHNWIESNVDWAVSRSRFWGAPLPVWENQSTGDYDVIGSLDELRDKTRSSNRFIFIRHGESVGNKQGVICQEADSDLDMLSEHGKEQVVESYEAIREVLEQISDKDERKVSKIVSSPFRRTSQTASMLAQEFGIDDITEDERLRERYFGDGMEGTSYEEYNETLKSCDIKDDMHKCLPGGEDNISVRARVMECIQELDAAHENETFIIVTHFSPLWTTMTAVDGLDPQEMVEFRNSWGEIHNAKPMFLDVAPIPHDEHYVLDMHRPYIDNITYRNEAGEEYKIIGEVFDCWYESGSMPFAAKRYLGEGTGKDFKYPADFICEAIDQTRGWFYSLLALGVGVFDKAPMQNVIVTGHVMAEDGKKMSKKLQNYPELDKVFDSYGADALRYFLLHSPVMRGEKVNLVEKEIDEIQKKIIMRLKNTLVFFQTYQEGFDPRLDAHDSPHPLDQWILSRLAQVHAQATEGLDNYELDKACYPFLDFVDDLSTWYLRRSRDRLKAEGGEDKAFAQATTAHVLREFAKVLAPFMPFVADYVYRRLELEHDRESVHLEVWSDPMQVHEDSLRVMDRVRDLVTTALDARVSAGIKVRQPLGGLTIRDESFGEDEEGRTRMLSEVVGESLRDIIRDELNVKEVVFGDTDMEQEVLLDTVITPQLQVEGDFREFVRSIQSMRKALKLSPHDKVELRLVMDEGGKDMIDTYFAQLEHTAGVAAIDWVDSLDTETQHANEVAYQVEVNKM